jgi:hypothetical protein
MVQTGGESDTIGEGLVAVSTSCTKLGFDVSRFGFKSNFEMTGFPITIHKLGKRSEIQMPFPAAFSQVGRNGAHIAVIGGEGPIQQSHQAAKRGGLVDQNHISSRFGQVQRRFDSANSTAYDENFTIRKHSIGLTHLFLLF